jgi:hypothetical protein
VSEGAVPNLGAPVIPEIITEVHVEVLPESSTDVVVRSLEIQDVECDNPPRKVPYSIA